jgi:hypothetical protein
MITTTTRLRSINPVHLGLILGITYALISLLFVLIAASFGTMMGGMMPGALGMHPQGFGFGWLVFAPVLYFIAGFLSGLIGAAIFNLVASWIGGLEITLEHAG